MKKLTLFLFLLSGFSAHAELVDKTADVNLVKSRQQFNRVERTLNVPVSITNTSDNLLEGEQRLLILNPSIPLAASDGVQEDGTPYISTSVSSLAPGESTFVVVRFQLQRRRLTFDTQFFVDVPELEGPLLADLAFEDEALAQCVSSTAENNEISLISDLTALDCSNSQLFDLSGIGQLTALSNLDISQTNVIDLTPLFSVDTLSVLNVDQLVLDDRTQVDQLIANDVLVNGELRIRLSSLSFPDTTLSACVQQAADTGGFEFVSELTAISCSGTELSDLTGLEQLTGLVSFTVFDTSVEEFSVVNQLPNLVDFIVRGSDFDDSDLENIIETPSLRRVSFNNTAITDLSILVPSQIETLALVNTILDVSPLEASPSLRTLILFGEVASDFSDVGNLRQLTSLTVFGLIDEEDLNVIYQLEGLEFLRVFPLFPRLDNAGLQERINALPNLTTVIVENSEVTNLDPLSQLANLQEVQLRTSPIEDIGALFIDGDISNGPIPTLRRIDVNELTVVTDSVLASQIQALRDSSQVEVTGEVVFGRSISSVLENISDEALRQCIIDEFDSGRFVIAEQITSLSCEGVADFSGLEQLTFLSELRLESTSVRDLSGLSVLNALTNLTLDDFEGSYGSLEALTNLESLSLSGIETESFSDIANLTQLTRFSVFIEELSQEQIDIVYQLVNLTDLNIRREVPLDDAGLAEMLEALPNLEVLRLNNSVISNLDPISVLGNVTEVDLESTPIQDLSALFVDGDINNGPIPSLQFVTVRDTPVLPGADNNLVVQVEALRNNPGVFVSGELAFGGLISDFLVSIEDEALRQCLIDNGIEELFVTGQQFSNVICGFRSISSLAGLEELTGLSSIFIDNTLVSDLTPILELPNLFSINIDNLSLNDPTQLDVLRSRGVRVAGELLSGTLLENFLATVPDDELRACIVNSTSGLRAVSQVRSLFCDGFDIENLSGIEQLFNLQSLSLLNTNISDLSPISGLINLAVLDLQGTILDDLSGLESLVNLQLLRLRNAQIADLSAIADLPNLNFIDIERLLTDDESQLDLLRERGVDVFGNISVLLSSLTFSDPALELCVQQEMINNDIQLVSELSVLFCFDPALVDLSGIEGLTALEFLELSSASVSDFSELSSLPNLTGINVGGPTIDESSLTALVAIPNLQTLRIFNSALTDLSPLSMANSLVELFVEELNASLLPLAEIESLRILGFGANPTTDFSELLNFTQLTSLSVSRILLSQEQIDIVYQLSNLEELNIRRLAPIDDLELQALVESLPNLTTLDVSDSDVTRLDAVSELRQVRNVFLNESPIQDISGLFINGDIVNGPIPTLSFVDITQVPFIPGSESNLLEQVEALRTDPRVFVSGELATGLLISDFLSSLPDESLRACIAANTEELAVTGQITFIACGGDVSDLTGVETLTNVQSVFIDNTDVTDLTPILELPNLWNLGIDGLLLDDPSQLDSFIERGVNVSGTLRN